jgi:hypothetical protein
VTSPYCCHGFAIEAMCFIRPNGTCPLDKEEYPSMDKRIQRALDATYCVYPCNIVIWKENGTSIRSYKGKLVELPGPVRPWSVPDFKNAESIIRGWTTGDELPDNF